MADDEGPLNAHPALVAYLARLPELANDPTVSEFWRDQLARGRDTGYEFERTPVAGKKDPAVLRARKTWEKAERRLNRVVKAGAIDEHARALAVLRRQKLLNPYLAFLQPLGLRSSMSTARHWYYAHRIREHVADCLPPGPHDVLEIGAGAGNLAYILHTFGLVRSYTIVDLPEMLAHSGRTLTELIPAATFRFPGDTGPATFSLLIPAEIDELPDASVDVALNFNSFMEMDRQVRDGYIAQIYRVARPGRLFVNVNRRQPALPLPDGSTWDSNPLLYPYRADEVLEWGADPFQTAMRAWPNRAPNLAVYRAALIGGLST